VDGVAGTGTLSLGLKAAGIGITDVAGNPLAPIGAGGIGGGAGSGTFTIVQTATIVTVAPTFTAVSEAPSKGLLEAGDTDMLALAISAAVTVTGTPTLSLNDGGTAIYDAGASTATSLVFDYSVSRSDQNVAALSVTSINLTNGATIVDATGDAANLSLAGLSQTGPQVAPNLSLFGEITHDVTSAGGDIYALYEAILGRAPDPSGFETFVAEREAGISLRGIANDLLSSRDDLAEYGHTSRSAFVDRIFENALHRAPSSSELKSWDHDLQSEPRARVAVEISTSSESRANLASVFQTGVFVPNESDSTIARLFYGLLDRAPDAGGLAALEGAAAKGTSLKSITKDILQSSEYVALHGSQNNAQFVEALFEGAFGRGEGAHGADGYLHLLNTGTSRAAVALSIVRNPEAVAHLNPSIESGFHVA
jgi:hypothetical protein